jgi:toxin YoeB
MNPAEQLETTRATVFTPEFLEDLRWWVDTNPMTALRVLDLIEATMRDPLKGAGKPEKLKHWEGSAWSRRVDEANRLVYLVVGDRVSFLQYRYHYE